MIPLWTGAARPVPNVMKSRYVPLLAIGAVLWSVASTTAAIATLGVDHVFGR